MRTTTLTFNAQGTAEWLEERRLLSVTGSMIGAILGVSPFMTPTQALRAKVREYNGLPDEIPEFVKKVIFEYGKLYEPIAIEQFELDYGVTVKECGLFRHKNGWLGASPDGLVGDDGILEVKCPYSLREGGEFKTVADQPHYFAQKQYEMLCAKRKKAHFYQWSPKIKPRYEFVEYNPDYIRKTLPRLKEFHELYLIERDKPEKYSDIQNPDAEELLNEYDACSEIVKAETKRKKEIITKLAEMTGGESNIICGRKFTKVKGKETYDYERMIKEHNIDKSDYIKSTGKPSYRVT